MTIKLTVFEIQHDYELIEAANAAAKHKSEHPYERVRLQQRGEGSKIVAELSILPGMDGDKILDEFKAAKENGTSPIRDRSV